MLSLLDTVLAVVGIHRWWCAPWQIVFVITDFLTSGYDSNCLMKRLEHLTLFYFAVSCLLFFLFWVCSLSCFFFFGWEEDVGVINKALDNSLLLKLRTQSWNAAETFLLRESDVSYILRLCGVLKGLWYILLIAFWCCMMGWVVLPWSFWTPRINKDLRSTVGFHVAAAVSL